MSSTRMNTMFGCAGEVRALALRIEEAGPTELPKKSIPKAKAAEANTTPIFLIPNTFLVGYAKPEGARA
jgi:hypothetical protein